MEPATTTPTAAAATDGAGATSALAPPPRAVTFTTATTYTFDVAHGGSAVPKTTGPPIGLAPTHTSVTCTDLSTSKHCRRGSVRKFNHLERIDLLKQAEYHVQDIAEFCVEALAIRKSRADTADEVKAEKKASKRARENSFSDQRRATTYRRRMTLTDPSMRLSVEA